MPRLGTLVVLLLLALPGAASAATGGVTVEVSGIGGTVTGPDINCPVDCFDDASWPNTQQLPSKFTLAAHRPTGVNLEWTGCTVLANDRCEGYYGDMTDGDGRGTVVGATFTDVAAPTIPEILSPGIDRQYGGNEDVVVKVRAADNWSVKQVAFTLGGKTITDTAPDFGTDSYQATFKTSEIAHGGYDVKVVATDFGDNASQPTSIPITVDKNPPTLALTGGVAVGAWHAKGPAELTFTTGFDAATVQCSLHRDNATPAWGACTAMNLNNGRHSATPSGDGNWILAVRVADGEGNEKIDGRLFKVDATDPDIGLEGGPDRTVVQQGVATPIRGLVADANLKSQECRVNGGPWQSCVNGGWQAEPNAAEGLREWEFRATDQAGNTKAVAKSWKVDGTAPAITVEGGPAEGATVVPGTYGYLVAADDAVTGASSVLCAWDGEQLATCPFDESTSRALGEGAHQLRVRAVDGVGNVSTLTRSFTVKAPASGGDKQPDNGGGGDKNPPSGGGGGDSAPPAPQPGPPSTGGGPATPRTDRTAPVLTVSAPKKARSTLLRKGLTLTIGCSEACKGSAKLSGPKGLKGSATIAGAGKLNLKLGAAALKKALRGRKRVTLTITVTVTDAAGNAAARKVTLTATR
jgi:hypothetical protein